MQRNPYKGSPLRPWVRVQLIASDGQDREFECVADTGSPFALIIGTRWMEQFRGSHGATAETNFRTIVGGFLHVRILGTEFDETLLGHAGDWVVQAVQASSASFEGVIGLPLLRRVEYGGNADQFWVL